MIKIKRQKIRRDSAALLRLLRLKDAELSILFVNDRQMKELNHKYRGIDRTTDVLSFPQYERSALRTPPYPPLSKGGTEEGVVLGDIVINLQAAKRQAHEDGLSFTGELQWLLVHGVLHLIGYDHERSKYAERKMRTMEKELLGHLGRSKN
ncbi:MAG: rRNA maturation RNase YbeY [Nitrospirae bacterium]|nr:rRNA maturation RNase YbeY [Nitrospirota bacterium]